MVTLLSWLDDHQAPWLLLLVVLLVQTGGLASSTHLFIRRTGDCQLMIASRFSVIVIAMICNATGSNCSLCSR